jgi:hemoglobin
MLKDQRVAHYYTNSDMKKLRIRQKQFITLVSGGPNNYEGSDMKTAHCKHSIGHMEFDATWENLEGALQFFKVPSK